MHVNGKYIFFIYILVVTKCSKLSEKMLIGWTSWCVAAVDQTGRVAAIVPIVLDAINFVTVEHHQWRSYGGWTYFLGDYYDMNITARFDDPNMVKLQEIEDPYFYRERLTMPKFVVNAGQDEFQQPDDTHYWWSEMPGPKHFLLMPNTEHMCVLGIAQAIPAIGTWIAHLVKEIDVPQISWTISKANGDIIGSVSGTSKVPNVTMWYAKTCSKEIPARRDFRLLNLDDPCTCGVAFDGQCINQEAGRWYPKILFPEADGTYVAHVDAVEEGRWTAFFIDFTFPVDNAHLYTVPMDYSIPTEPDQVGTWPYDLPGQLDFTTEVSIWPDVFPFEDCFGTECYGTLL